MKAEEHQVQNHRDNAHGPLEMCSTDVAVVEVMHFHHITALAPILTGIHARNCLFWKKNKFSSLVSCRKLMTN